METRASYIAVGAFVVLLMLGLIGFVAWLTATGTTEADEVYIIDFTGSVTGLQIGSSVRYRGIPVGTVSDIRLNPDNFEEVRVTIQVRPDTPIVTDNVASLELQGITGGVYVLIGGGRQDSPRLMDQDRDDDLPPEIRSRPSTLEAVVQSIPEVLERVSTILDRANALLSDENVAAVSDVLGDLRDISDTIADRNAGLAAAVDRISALSVNLDGLVSEARVDLARLSDGAATTLDTATEAIDSVQVEIQALSRGLRTTSNQISQLLDGVEPGAVEFANEGLYEFTLMISELRGLATVLSRVTEQFERNPAQFLLGEQTRGVEIE